MQDAVSSTTKTETDISVNIPILNCSDEETKRLRAIFLDPASTEHDPFYFIWLSFAGILILINLLFRASLSNAMYYHLSALADTFIRCLDMFSFAVVCVTIVGILVYLLWYPHRKHD